CGQSPTSAASTQFGGEGTDDAWSGCTQGVADGDGSAVGVDDFGVQLFPAAYAGQGLGREGLVEFDDGKVGPADPGPFQGDLGGTDRTDTDLHGDDSDDPTSCDAGDCLQTCSVSGGPVSDRPGCGAVVDGLCDSGCDGALGA